MVASPSFPFFTTLKLSFSCPRFVGAQNSLASLQKLVITLHAELVVSNYTFQLLRPTANGQRRLGLNFMDSQRDDNDVNIIDQYDTLNSNPYDHPSTDSINPIDGSIILSDDVDQRHPIKLNSRSNSVSILSRDDFEHKISEIIEAFHLFDMQLDRLSDSIFDKTLSNRTVNESSDVPAVQMNHSNGTNHVVTVNMDSDGEESDDDNNSELHSDIEMDHNLGRHNRSVDMLNSPSRSSSTELKLSRKDSNGDITNVSAYTKVMLQGTAECETTVNYFDTIAIMLWLFVYYQNALIPSLMIYPMVPNCDLILTNAIL
jgi:hypothetical protein